jgi:leucine dehydrogenase
VTATVRRTFEPPAAEELLLPDYEEIRAVRGQRSGMTMVVAVHRTVSGRSLGGCRLWRYATAAEAVQDAKRLARSMTFKAAVAGLPLGGGKSVIALREGQRLSKQRRREVFHDFAELVESFEGRYVTAQDVGTTLDDIMYVSRFTDHVAGHPTADGGAGDPSPYTAHGLEVAIRASLGGGSLAGRHVVVIGLGHVGGDLARRLHGAGVRLTVTDADERRRSLADQLGAEWVTPAAALGVEADLLAPCALGGILDFDTIGELRVPVVAGAANNQLADDAIAERLRERGILWAPDFVANAGGLIAVADELNGFDLERVERAIEGIGETLAEIYARADAAGVNTLVAAQALAAERSPLD